MRGSVLPLLLLVFLPLAGCSVNGTTPSPTPLPTPSPSSVSNDWLFSTVQPGSGSVPASGLIMTGAITQTGSALTGTFLILGNPTSCGVIAPETLGFTGSVSTSNQITLQSTDETVMLSVALPSGTSQLTTGTVGTTGRNCALAYSAPVYGIEFASATGTYTGAVTSTALSPLTPGPAGTQTLTLTQEATPDASGVFGLTGTLNFASGTCTSSIAVTGTVSGGILTLQAASGLTGPLAQDLANGAQLATGIELTTGYPTGPCAGTTGTLALYSGLLSSS